MLRRRPALTAIAMALVAALVLRGLLDLLLPDLETWINAIATGLTAGASGRSPTAYSAPSAARPCVALAEPSARLSAATPGVTAMTTALRQGVGAAVAREVRESPVSTLLAPAALIGLSAWLVGYRGPLWWRQATGRDVDEHRSPDA